MRSLDKLRSEMLALRERIAQRPIRVPVRGGPATPYISLQIGGGNALSSGQQGIVYTAVPVLSQVWNPALMPTAMDPGLGWGYEFVDGSFNPNPQLIWHQFAGMPLSLLSGQMMRGASKKSLSYAGTSMSFWTVDWG